MASARDIVALADGVVEASRRLASARSLLVAVSGIDASGKGYVSAKLAAALTARGLRPALINVDGWLNLPDVRFDPLQPAECFYLRAIRFDELFERLVLPLRDRRSVRVEADFAEERAREFRRQTYAFDDVDVVILEGIYLLKRVYRRHYDLSCWVDCAFETALRRAVARGQEGLSPEDTIRAYRTIYFPAQAIHFERDEPRAAADVLLDNDDEMSREGAVTASQASDDDRLGFVSVKTA